LVLDHFFDQDIAALRAATHPDEQLRTLSYDVLREEALRVFPEEVTSGLEPLSRPALEPLRQAYTRRLQRLLEDEWVAWPFDVFVAPSDLFFYVRALPAACHRLGVPFVVAQKETTVARTTLEQHADVVRQHAPPLADAMTACSERQKAFWVRAGADPQSVVVTGQPRFDVYATGRHGAPASARPKALFFSYHADAYHPTGAGGAEGTPAWRQLHNETEQALWQLVRNGWDVVIKPHPQQDFAQDRRRIAAELPGELVAHIRFADPSEDARHLILDADVIVGFQTTALIESVAAGKPVVFTGWDDEWRRLREELIPFHRWPDVFRIVERAEDLPGTIAAARGTRLEGAAAEHAAAVVEDYLGPVDGGAGRRVLDVVRSHSDAWADGREAASIRRREQLARSAQKIRHARRAYRRGRRVITLVARVSRRTPMGRATG
jgi:hypothetical protein